VLKFHKSLVPPFVSLFFLPAVTKIPFPAGNRNVDVYTVFSNCVLVILMLAFTTKELRWPSQNRDCATGWTIQVSRSENCKEILPFFTQKQGQTECFMVWVPGVFPKSEAVGV
jgi:hypothetical protein